VRTRLLVVLLAILALPTVAAGGIFNPLPRKRPAPALAGTDPVTGRHVSLAQWEGKPLLVNLWGSWCNPCREEAPVLRAFLVKHPGSLLGIDIEDSKAGARSFQRRYGVRFPNIFDPLDVIVGKLRPIGTPSTYFLDRKHRIVAVVYEPATTAQLERGWKLATAKS
jgi:thiol-disulfide isomerase/thioredoxin